MKLSQKAINDLRKELLKVYGSDFDLTDEDLQEIGMFLLTALAESLKYKASIKNLPIWQNIYTKIVYIWYN